MTVLLVLLWVLWIQGRSGLHAWIGSWPSRLRGRARLKTAGMP